MLRVKTVPKLSDERNSLGWRQPNNFVAGKQFHGLRIRDYTTAGKQVVLSETQSSAVLRRFRSEIQERRFRVVLLRSHHFDAAESLIAIYGPSQGLRTLDALHLAVAIDLKHAGIVSSMLAADKILCRVAVLEGFPAADPLTPRASAQRTGQKTLKKLILPQSNPSRRCSGSGPAQPHS
jgi:hypothetical protein